MTQGKARMMNNPHRKALLKLQGNNGNEHLIALKDGKVIARATSDYKFKVAIPDCISKRIINSNENIKIMHNHPSGGSFSRQDVELFRDYPGLMEFTAEGKKVSFSIQRTIKTGKIDMAEFAQLQKKFTDILEPHVYHSDPTRPYLHPELAKKAILHALIQSLDKQGFVTYLTDGNLQKEERIIDDYLRSSS